MILHTSRYQQDVGDGVNYAPIFASDYGYEAVLIAFDGPGFGNDDACGHGAGRAGTWHLDVAILSEFVLFPMVTVMVLFYRLDGRGV